VAEKVENLKELELEYPCDWEYRLIVLKGTNITQIIENIVDKREFSLVTSKNSKNGKYESFSLKLLVHNDEDRKTLYETFKRAQEIKFVL
jgi:putative lipoic acid-binding regulatory protein